MENAAANARIGRSISVLSTIWRGVVRISLYNRLGHMSVMLASRSDDAPWQLLSLFGLITSCFRGHKRVAATVQQEMTFNRELAAGALTEAHADSSTRKPSPLPPEVQRRLLRHDASAALRALEFALPGQW